MQFSPGATYTIKSVFCGDFVTCREKILSEDYYDLITDYLFTEEFRESTVPDYCFTKIDDKYGLVYVRSDEVPAMNAATFGYSLIPKLYGLMQDFNQIPLIESNITRVQQPPLSLTGSGVIIACIDTGINWEKEEFRDSAGNSRILNIWDQTIQTGTPPEGFLYGTEYTRDEINQALRGEITIETTDEIGHGSAIASVAAGSNLGNGLEFLGAAPDADIVMIKLKGAKQYLREYYLIPDGVPAYAEGDIMNAVNYCNRLAILYRRPIVICIGLGTSYGNHTGDLPLPTYLDKIASFRNRSIVVCAGNEGNAAHHYFGQIVREEGTAGEIFDEVEISVGPGEKGFILELWGTLPNVYWITLRSPSGEVRQGFRPGFGQSQTYRFIYERTEVTLDTILVEPGSGEELFLMRFANPVEGIWTILVSLVNDAREGSFHVWLPITQFLSSQTVFLEPNPYTTITNPGYSSLSLTVGGYDTGNNGLYVNTGRGFAKNGEIKPDIVAPAVGISTSEGVRNGTSFSAAFAAGCAAQFFEWAVTEGNEPLIRNRELKNYFIRGARREMDRNYPSREWGYGSLDIQGVFDVLAGI